jgi:hypothetical protein
MYCMHSANVLCETLLLEEVDKFGTEFMHHVDYIWQILTEIKFERFPLTIQNLIRIREVVWDEKPFYYRHIYTFICINDS